VRIFIGFIEVSGRNNALKRGFDALGIPCTFISFFHHRFKYNSSNAGLVQRFFDSLATFEGHVSKKAYALRLIWACFHQGLRLPLFIWALCTHDVFIFSFKTSFFCKLDLPILKLFKKKIIYQFHGSDSRPPYIGWGPKYLEHDKPLSQDQVMECIRQARKQKNALRIIDRYANAVIDIAPQAYFHERTFVNRLMVGLPSGPYELPQVSPNIKLPIRILHAPSHVAAKGTVLIRQIIERIKSKGYDINYIEVMNQPHEVVLEELRQCDIVFDQLYTDYSAPGFATEAYWFGKPVLSSGCAVELWEEILPDDKRPPSIYVRLEDIEANLEKLIADPVYRKAIGKKSRDFVLSRWHPKQVAQNYLKVIAGDIPKAWIVDPSKTKAVYGGFFTDASKAKEMTRKVIECGGIEALQLSDKPQVEQKFIEFASIA
jgi:hypothetical protein